MINPVGIIGSGNWGTTLAHLIARGETPVLLWSRNEAIAREINEKRTNVQYAPNLKLEENIKPITELAEVVKQCKVIFVAVPSKAIREISRSLGDYVRGDQILISCAKGIENKTFRTMSEILKEETCAKKVGVLSGPNIAAEIIQGDPSGSVIASEYNEVIERVMAVLSQPLFKVYGNKDIKGVEIGGALKNIIAIASGIATGLGLGNNSKAFLITRGIVEISRYGKFFGARPQTFFGLSGIGDLITTCYSPHSRNHRFGREIVKGKKMEEILKEFHMVVEGIYTAEAVYALSKKFNIFMPITEGIYRVLFEGVRVEAVIQELMASRSKFEDEGCLEEFSAITHMLVNKYPIAEYFV